MSEFLAALDGFTEARGGKKKVAPPSESQIDDLIAKYGTPRKPA
ncbi:hypothetical protein OHAE_3641 [Ochrobactrum soli]|uniref:Uncharacterized protein n=2 Tax=Ochrobactrum soli TaxID=2448455 RepID=A0A2P9HHY6_9HYPH|nr:hypothetical protein OHAE_3641 [[Ochrobactrum] soli]